MNQLGCGMLFYLRLLQMLAHLRERAARFIGFRGMKGNRNNRFNRYPYLLDDKAYLLDERIIGGVYQPMNTYHMQAICRFGFATTLDIDSQKTFNLLVKKLKSVVEYSTELQAMMIDEPKTNEYSKKQMSKDQIRRQLNRLAPAVTLHGQIDALLQNIKDLEEMIKQTTSGEDKAILNKEMKAMIAKKAELKEECITQLIPPSAFDEVNEVTMEFKPGAGGLESSIFVEDISQMYINFCEAQGWRTSIVGLQKEVGASKGYKYINIKVVGENVHKILKCESGVHKVIRVPQTESKGRLHSSTISLVIMPTVPFNFHIDTKDIKYQFTRSSGPGGQGVNKTESACRAVHIPSGLQVFIQQDRSQQMNKKRATQILKERLFQIQYQKVVKSESQTRKSQVTSMDRSQKIRTYNYPQDRITDHRTGLTLFGIQNMMKGTYVQQFIDAYGDKVNKQKLDAMLAQLHEEDK